jgi:hypothetical protein
MEYDPFLLVTSDNLLRTFHCIFRGDPFGEPCDLYYAKSDNFTNIPYDDLITFPKWSMLKAYPNPFNSQIVLALNDREGGETIIEIFDIKGRLVKSFKMEGMRGGDKTAVWDATGALGNRVSSGIYFARAETPQTNYTIKLIYLK